MISEASDRLQMAQEACLDGDILTSFEGFCTTGPMDVAGVPTIVLLYLIVHRCHHYLRLG